MRLVLPSLWTHVRSLSTTRANFLKAIHEKKDGNKTFITGKLVESDRKGKVAAAPAEARGDACPLCKLGLKGIKYSDVLILSQFIGPDGNVMSIDDSKLCVSQYRKIVKMVEQAQKCRLLPRPAGYEVFGPWDTLKTYRDWPPRRRDVEMSVVQPYYWKNIEHNEY